jgi:3-dehydroquinate synthase
VKIEICTNPSYTVTVENGVINRTGKIISEILKKDSKILIVSDSNVFPLYGSTIEKNLQDAGFRVCKFIFEAGETSKKLNTVSRIYEKMAEAGFTRTDAIVTLGGGVAGDMGGFAAATFLRGISFVQIPTSLLAQVDASVGGKTGVDIVYGKNLVGAFHQPRAVIIDPDTLKTLPQSHINDGLGEIIKYGCISDKELFDNMEKEDFSARFRELISVCVKSKKEFVEEDARDTGRRMLLNFGHTFGHALEKLNNFQRLLHGEAVGIGMLIAAGIGEQMGITEAGTEKKIEALLKKYGLPTEPGFSSDDILAETALDKKGDGDSLNLILLKAIGEAKIVKVPRKEIRRYMR